MYVQALMLNILTKHFSLCHIVLWEGDGGTFATIKNQFSFAIDSYLQVPIPPYRELSKTQK